MDENKNNKTLIVFVILSLIITIAIAIIFNNQQNIKYENYSLSAERLTSLKKELLQDAEFTKISLIDYSRNTASAKISNMLKSLKVEELTVEDTKYVITRSDFNQAFMELYGQKADNININTYTKLINATEDADKIYFDIESADNDNIIFIGITNLDSKKNNLVAKLYIYETYTNDPDEEALMISEVNASIRQNGYLKQCMIDTYNISVTEKTLTFKEVSNSKFFKYQLISNKDVNNQNLWQTDDEGYFGTNTLIAIYSIIGVIVAGSLIIIYFKVRNSNR